jgi:hypothetical protein
MIEVEMYIWNQKKNNRGFSLLEIIMVAGMLGGLGLVVMNLTKQTSRSSSKYQFDSEINLITSEINAIISNPVTCLATFGANALTPTSINGKYYTVASGLAPVTGYGNGGVQVASYTLVHSTLAGATASDGILTIQFKNKAIVGGTTTPRTINVYYEGPISAITTCRSLSTSSTDVWSHGAGTDIYYNLGKVGIGTTAPSTNLDIESSATNGSGINLKSALAGGKSYGIYSTNSAASGGAGNFLVYSPNNTNGNTVPFLIQPNGNVGIGTYTPTKTLDVVGDIQSSATMWATSFTYTSDKKLKKNIHPIDQSLEKVLALRGVYFDWKDNDKHDVGFIAQEVKKQIPEIVKYDSSREILTVDYAKVVPFLVEAIKKQQEEIKDLKKEIRKLQR